MCGLVGYVGLRAPEAQGEALLRRMSSRIAHRGPDDDGLWIEDGTGLAHRRLSIIDLSPLGHQPMHSPCGRYAIAYNGEVYNYLELRRDLEGAGEVFRGHSDTEVLLAALRKWGPQALERCNGMWALAVWDRQERRLFASRDRFGKKPFYYMRHGGGLLFASEIKGLLATGQVRPKPNLTAIADFAAERISDFGEQTFFEGVVQLPAGHSLDWQEGGELRVTPYWTLKLEPGVQPAVTPADVLDGLQDAVRLRLRADTPVGVLLSGGLDSSAVTCLAARELGKELHAFSTLDEVPVEEAAGIEQVRQAYPQVVLHRDTLSDDGFADELDNCLWHQEEPFADGSMVAHFRLMRKAREAGVKVLLTGQGADEVFAGYPGFLTVHLSGLLAGGRIAEFMECSAAIAATGQKVSRVSALGHALPVGIKSMLRERRWRESLDWLHPDCRQVSPAIRRGYGIAAGGAALNAALVDAINFRTLPGFLHYEDRNSMAFGVETRLPFLDYRLVQQVVPSPAARKIEGGMTKALLRQAMTGIVPAPIVNRAAKTGYPAPLARWLRKAGPQSWERWEAAVRACPLILADKWQAQRQRFFAAGDAALPQVWRGLALALWYQRFIAAEQGV